MGLSSRTHAACYLRRAKSRYFYIQLSDSDGAECMYKY